MIRVLILLLLSFNASAQYKIRMIADDGANSDTLYLKDNTDSLFRKAGAAYNFVKKEGVRSFLPYWTIQGAPAGGNSDWADVTNKPSTFTPSSHTHTTADITNYDVTDMKAYQALGSPIKAQTVGIPLQLANTSSSLTDGQIRWVAVYLDKAATLTGLSVYMRTAGSYTGDNNNRVGLYTYSAGTLTLVASSTNSSTLWTAAGNAFLNVNFSSTYSAAQGLYFAAILYNNSAQTTAPAIATGTALNNAAMATIGFTNSAKLYGTSNGTDLPASIAMSSITASTATTWIGLF